MYLFRYTYKSIASLVVTLLSWLLAPITAIYETTPKWLEWTTTHDVPISESARYFPKYHPYLQRFLWVIRNPGYAFNFSVLGTEFVESNWSIRREYGDDLRDGEYKTSGTAYVVGTQSEDCGGIYYQGAWGKYKLGYNLYNFRYRSAFLIPEKTGPYMMWKFSINPFWGLKLLLNK